MSRELQVAPHRGGGARELVVARDAHHGARGERVFEMQLEARRPLDRHRAREASGPVHQRRLAQETHGVGARGVDVAVDGEQRRAHREVLDHRRDVARARGEDRRLLRANLHAPVLETEGALHRVDRRPVAVVLQHAVAHVAFDQEMAVAAVPEREAAQVALQLEGHAVAAARLDRALGPFARDLQAVGHVVGHAGRGRPRQRAPQVHVAGRFGQRAPRAREVALGVGIGEVRVGDRHLQHRARALPRRVDLERVQGERRAEDALEGEGRAARGELQRAAGLGALDAAAHARHAREGVDRIHRELLEAALHGVGPGLPGALAAPAQRSVGDAAARREAAHLPLDVVRHREVVDQRGGDLEVDAVGAHVDARREAGGRGALDREVARLRFLAARQPEAQPRGREREAVRTCAVGGAAGERGEGEGERVGGELRRGIAHVHVGDHLAHLVAREGRPDAQAAHAGAQRVGHRQVRAQAAQVGAEALGEEPADGAPARCHALRSSCRRARRCARRGLPAAAPRATRGGGRGACASRTRPA